MIGLLQRVTEARVEVGGNLVGAIGPGLPVPQFTLAADTRKGARPSFTRAAQPGNGTTAPTNFHEQPT
ncbi:MAG: D-aminoacyl-tRNA deacylase [Betaproteobacteria bacterium]|nr:D-aminoacyl-tRNA deacylase [Betaproteobacteria bacterium]